MHNKSDNSIKDLFNNRVNDTNNRFRVYLLVNMGTEGWNCPSLFATALARRLKSSNNFVLQSASRCLRQVPNNTKKARIYLSKENVSVLDSQLKETFGESLQILDMTKQELGREKLVLRAVETEPILLKKRIRRVFQGKSEHPLQLHVPAKAASEAKKVVYDFRQQLNAENVLEQKRVEELTESANLLGIHQVAVELSAIYRLDLIFIYRLLSELYPLGEINASHVNDLKQQIEKTKNYQIVEEEIELGLAIIKTGGFSKEEVNGKTVFVSEIVYHKEKADLLLHYDNYKQLKSSQLSFHYSPYNMDSHPEKDFFVKVIEKLDENPDDIKDIYFTGALTDSNKTDFLFEYKDKKGKMANVYP